MDLPRCCFDAIVVTAPNQRVADAAVGELKIAWERACAPGSQPLLLASHDPLGARVGSGGGTLNALDAAARALAAAAGKKGGRADENPDFAPLEAVIAAARKARILIVHSGGDSQRSPLQSVCGKAWCALSSARVHRDFDLQHPSNLLSTPRTPMELLISTLCGLSGDGALPPGSSVVACSDVLLLVPASLRLGFLQDSQGGAVTGLALAADKQYGPKHGVYTTAAAAPTTSAAMTADRPSTQPVAPVRRFLQKASLPELGDAGAVSEEGTVLVDTGVVCFNEACTAALLTLAAASPLNGSTLSASARYAAGVVAAAGDEGSAAPKAIRIELYSDILLAVGNVGGFEDSEQHGQQLATNTAKDRYLAFLSAGDGSDATARARLATARGALWDALHGMKFGACCAASKEEEEDARFGHLGTTTEQMQMLRGEMSAFVKPFGIRPQILASITASETVASDHHRLTHESSVVINSHLHFGFEEEDSSEGTNDTSPGTVARIGSGAVVEHCEISGSGWAVGSGAMVSGVRHTGNGWLPGSSQVDTPLFTTESAVVAAASVGTPEATGKGGYDLVVPPGMCVQENAIVWPQHNSETPASGTAVAADGGEEGGYFAVTLLGVSDGVKDLFVEEQKKGTESKNTDGKAPSTVCGVQWLDFFAMSGVSPSDVWPADSTPRQDLWHAKLIPVCRAIAPAHHHHSPAPPPPGVTVLDDWRRAPGVVFWPLWLSAGVAPSAEAMTQWKGLTRLSLKDLLGVASAPTEFKWRRCLETKVGRAIVARAQTQTIAPAVATAAAFVGRHPLKTPSKNTAPLPASSATSSAAPNIPPKTITLPCAVAKGAATASSSHQPPVTLSSSGGERRQVVQRVKVLRRVVVRAPARIDLAGGWSDTPPISYEHGGAVTNLGVLVDGRHPIVATVTVFEMPLPTSGDGTGDGDHQASLCPLYLSTSSGGDSSNSNGEEEEEEEEGGGFGDDVLGVSDLKGLKDFNIPSAPAALLKAALLCAGIVTLSSAEPLLEQLRERCGGGVKVETRSHLPQGSGLGTSSILSGALLCALGHAMGSPFAAIPTDGEVPLLPPRTPLDSADGNQNGDGAKKEEKSEEGSSLVHAVLMLEQMLTTGGGWQDQVGGCSPSAATIATSLPTLPLRVHCRPLTLPNGFADDLSKHLCLVFTGAPRLAKHLLVEVLRRWWSHEPNVRATAGALVGGAHTCAEALERGDLEGVGAALTNYHGMKRVMAGEGYDGEVGPALASTLNPFAHGLAYCGAGGGGFLAVLTKVPLDELVVGSVEPEGGGSSSPSSKKMKSCFEALSAVVEAHGGSVHRVQLAPSGLVVTTHTH